MFWNVLIVKPKSEKKIAKKLDELGFNTYCPLITIIKQWSDRKKKVEQALISTCVFIKVEEKDRNNVFQVPDILRYMFYLGKLAKVKDHEITTLKEFLKDDLRLVQIEKIQLGGNYIIPKGPFKGKKGVVNKIRTNCLQLILPGLGMKLTVIKE